MKGHNLVLALALFAAAAVAGYLFYDHTRDAAAPVATGAASGPVVAADPDPEAVGQMRPEFTLPDLSGRQRSITEWDGQAMIVNFWATWCPPCRREIPLLIEMQDRAGEMGIAIIGIAIDEPEAVQRYADETGFNYPVLIGEQAAVEAAEGFGADVVGLPLTVMTGRDGRVVELHAGELTRQDLEAAVARLGAD